MGMSLIETYDALDRLKASGNITPDNLKIITNQLSVNPGSVDAYAFYSGAVNFDKASDVALDLARGAREWEPSTPSFADADPHNS